MTTPLLDNGQTNTLIAGLRRHTTLAETLRSLLSDEFAAIKCNDAEALQRLSVAKLEILAKLEHNEILRQQFFARFTPNPDEQAQISSFAKYVPQNQRPLFTSVVETLTAALRACAQQNQINGASLTIVKRFTQDLLAHLHGIPQANATDLTYDRSGQGEASATSTGVVRA